MDVDVLQRVKHLRPSKDVHRIVRVNTLARKWTKARHLRQPVPRLATERKVPDDTCIHIFKYAHNTERIPSSFWPVSPSSLDPYRRVLTPKAI
jgi:hypothetical protein